MQALTIEGNISKLRPITIEDAEITLKWRLSDKAHMLQRGASTVDEQRQWIASRLHTDEINCIIEHKGLPVGMIALHDINYRHSNAVIGRLLIGEDGIVNNAPVAFEAEMMLCDHAFNNLKLHKIYGDVMEDNHRMIKTKLYLGYKQDGLLRDHYNYDGIFKSTIAISILEHEYHTKCRPKFIQLISLFSTP